MSETQIVRQEQNNSESNALPENRTRYCAFALRFEHLIDVNNFTRAFKIHSLDVDFKELMVIMTIPESEYDNTLNEIRNYLIEENVDAPDGINLDVEVEESEETEEETDESGEEDLSEDEATEDTNAEKKQVGKSIWDGFREKLGG